MYIKYINNLVNLIKFKYINILVNVTALNSQNTINK